MSKIKEDVIILGGGPAGLLTSYYLKSFGVDALVIEKGKIGQAWREMRDRMVMLSPAVASHDMTSLSFENPIWNFVKLSGPFATKEEFIEYLDKFVKKNKVRVSQGNEVTYVTSNPEGFEVGTNNNSTYVAKVVVVATGVAGNACLPDIPGMKGNKRVVHAKNYKGFEAYRDKKVLIVGAGNSGAELAVELSGISKVTLVNKHKLKYFSKTNNLSHIRGLSESLLKELIKFKIINLKERVELETIEKGKVSFSDATIDNFDEIIFATGYCANLPKFIDMKVKIAKNGYPNLSATCESVSRKSLYFTGPLAHNSGLCAFIHCFRPMVEPMALDIADKLGH